MARTPAKPARPPRPVRKVKEAQAAPAAAAPVRKARPRPVRKVGAAAAAPAPAKKVPSTEGFAGFRAGTAAEVAARALYEGGHSKTEIMRGLRKNQPALSNNWSVTISTVATALKAKGFVEEGYYRVVPADEAGQPATLVNEDGLEFGEEAPVTEPVVPAILAEPPTPVRKARPLPRKVVAAAPAPAPSPKPVLRKKSVVHFGTANGSATAAAPPVPVRRGRPRKLATSA